MADTLKSRSEVDVNLTWDLSLIYPSNAELQADLEKAKKLADGIETYKGFLNTPENIVACLDKLAELMVISDHAGNYTSLAVETDYTNAENQDASNRVRNLFTSIDSRLSFVDSEISEQSEETLTAAIDMATACKNRIKEILRRKPHMLHPEAEKAVAALSPTLGSPYGMYNVIKLADMDFEDFEADGKTYPLGYSLYEDDYEYTENTPVRRAAADAFYKKLSQYKNSTAAAFNAHVQQQKIMSELRHFSSMEEMDLFGDKVTSEMYNRQIDLITTRLAPHMRKLARLLKRIHKLDKMTYADLKLTVDPGYSPEVTLADAQKMISEGLSIMGSDYQAMVNEAFEKRWFDLAQNKGKCTGGFCSSPYGKNSFILLSWNGRMSDVFTMAHELGHAGHFRACNAAQSPWDTNVSTYFVEAPSTMNEILLAHHMLKTSTDKRFRRWVLANMVSNTYYHNFVTHLLEGAYQREVWKTVQEGGSVQADTLSGIFRDVLEKFWGEDVELMPGSELTWMRQPHYYMGLYSYSYSAGLTVATQMCKRIEKEGAPAVEDWKKVLAAGGTLAPMELAKLGGIDISTDAALIDTIETIGSYIDEIEKLTDELEAENK